MTGYQKTPTILKKINGRPVIETSRGGRILLDEKMDRLLESANSRTLDEIIALDEWRQYDPDLIRAYLACLVEAGLIARDSSNPAVIANPASTGPLVSVVIVSFNGWNWLQICLPSLFSQSYAPIEILIVDNSSSDDTAHQVERHYSRQVTLISLDNPVSFAGAVNKGISNAHGEFLLVLNQDVCLKPDAVAEMIRTVQSRTDIAAVAPKLHLYRTPGFLNGIGNQVGSFSWGWDNGLGHLDLGQFDSWGELPSACFAAALIPRSAWDVIGPCDEDFPLYYEDSEWSYRARSMGYKIMAAPQAVVEHGFSSHQNPTGFNALSSIKLRNVTYGRLRFAMLISGRTKLTVQMAGYILHDILYVLNSIFHLHFSILGDLREAWSSFLKDLPQMRIRRKSIQARKTISDRQLYQIQRNFPSPMVWKGMPELTWDIIHSHYLPLFLSRKIRSSPEFQAERKPRLLIISHDKVDLNMAGPGMRYYEMARVLAKDLEVTLAVPDQTSIKGDGFILKVYKSASHLQALLSRQDVVLLSAFLLDQFPILRKGSHRLVIDFYDPILFENLALHKDLSLSARQELNSRTLQVLNNLAVVGDFFICGSERQRDFWLGLLAAAGRINPQTYDQDSGLRKLIDVVGIGIHNRPPVSKPFLRGIHPHIPQDAKIVLWGGGLWDWLDPISLIKAWPQVLKKNSSARLVFLGTRHPNPLVPVHQQAQRAVSLAKEIGEYDRTIVFIDWIPYEQREWLLCEANVGVVLHPASAETHFAIRTRVFDYFWACLPILITEGEITGDLVRQFGVGVVVPPEDPQAIACALDQLLNSPASQNESQYRLLRDKLSWAQTVAPLLDYCLVGKKATDQHRSVAVKNSYRLDLRFKYTFLRAQSILRTEGLGRLFFRIRKRIQFWLSRPSWW